MNVFLRQVSLLFVTLFFCVWGSVQTQASIGTQSIGGDVFYGAGDGVSVQYNFQSHGADLLNVTGAALIDGANLWLSAESGGTDDGSPGVQTFTILTAASVTGTFGVVMVEDSTVSARVIYNATSIQIELTRAPQISQQPEPSVLNPGASKTFTVAVNAVSGVSYSYQWYRNGEAVIGEQGTTYSFSNIQSAQAGAYWVTVTANGATAKSDIASVVVELSNFAEVHVALKSRNYDLASTKLAAILSAAPNNPQANVFKAITDIARLTTDPASKAMLTKLGFTGSSDLRNFTLEHNGFVATSLTAEGRTWLISTLYPKLKAADDLLGKVTDTGAIGAILDADLGDAASMDFKVFDYGDVQALRAGLNALMAFVKWMETQNTDVNLFALRNDAAAGVVSLESLLLKYPLLFAASSSAAAAQLEFTTRLKNATDYYLKFSDFANPLPAATGVKRLESFPALALLESEGDLRKERHFRQDCVLLQRSIAAVDALSGRQDFVRIDEGSDRPWITASPVVFVKHAPGMRSEFPAFSSNAYKIGSLKYESAVAFYPALTMKRLGEIEQKIIDAEPKITEKLGNGREKVSPVVVISKVTQVSPGWLSVAGTVSDSSGVGRVIVKRTTGTDVSTVVAVWTERLPVPAGGKRTYDWVAQLAAPFGGTSVEAVCVDTLGNRGTATMASTVASASLGAPIVPAAGRGAFLGQAASLVAAIPTAGKVQYSWKKNGMVVGEGVAFAVNDWASVSSGVMHSAAIKRDGTLWTWGTNMNSELGYSTLESISATPQQVGSDRDWKTVACSDGFTVALKRDGSLWAWGQTPWGQQGVLRVEASKSWRQIAAGQSHVLAIAVDGGLYAQGNGQSGQVGFDTDWEQVAAGNNRSFAVKSNGTLWAWGDNNSGTLGLDGWWFGDVPDPVQVGTETDWVWVSASKSTVGFGNNYSAAIKLDGTLWAWGETPQKGYCALPAPIGPEAGRWGGVHVGAFELLATSMDGTVYRVASDSTHPPRLSGAAISVSSGSGFYGAVTTDGVLWMWGQNDQGQLGNAHLMMDGRYYGDPMQVGVQSEWGLPSPATGIPVPLEFSEVTALDFGNYELFAFASTGPVTSKATLFEQNEQSSELLKVTSNVSTSGGVAPRFVLVQGGNVTLSSLTQAGSDVGTSSKWFKNGVAVVGNPSIGAAAGAGVYWTETTAVGGGSLRSEPTAVVVDSVNVAAARAALANKDYTTASQKVTAALSAAPGDATALLLRSLLDLFSLTSDARTASALASVGFSGSLDPWSFSLTRNPDGFPSGSLSSSSRAWLVGAFFQKLAAMDGNLAKIVDTKTVVILNSADFLPGKTTSEAVAVDYGDIQVLRSITNLMMALVKWVETQNTDVDFSMLQRYRESGVLSMQLLLAKYPVLFAASGTASAAQTEFVSRFKQALSLYLAFSDFANPPTGLPKRLDASLCVAAVDGWEDRRKETIARGDVVRTLESINSADALAGRRVFETEDGRIVVSANAFVKHAPGWRTEMPQFSRNQYVPFSFKPSVPQSVIPAFDLTQMADLEDSILNKESKLNQLLGTRDGNLIPQFITFPELADRASSAPTFRLLGAADSGLPVTFSVVSGPATISGSSLTLTKMGGVVTVLASQNGNGVYATASPVEQQFTVTATQVIIFPKPSGIFTYGDAPIALLASADSGLPVSFSVVSGAATIDGNTLTFTGAGDISIQASQLGSDVYLAAKPVKQTISVAKKPLSVGIDPSVRLVGFANPVFSFRYSGFVGSDGPDVLLKKPAATSTASLASAAGSYPVVASGASDKNYTFVYTPGTIVLNGFGGTYEALLLDTDHTTVGKLEVTVPENSLMYSGKLRITSESKPVTLVGSLVANAGRTAAESTLTLTRKDLPTLTLSFSVSGDTMTAGLTRGSLSELASGETGVRLYTVPPKASAPWAGIYTLVFREPSSRDSLQRDYPHGANYASGVILPATGIFTFTVKMSEGTAVTYSLKPDSRGRYRFLEFGAGLYVGGQLSLLAHPDVDRFPNGYYIPSTSTDSFLVWAKTPGAKDVSYRAGFGPLDYAVSLDPWRGPVTATKTVVARSLGQQLGLVSTSTESSTISVSYSPETTDLGTLGASFPTEISMSAAGAVAVKSPATTPSNATKWALTISPATGLFSGSFVLVDRVSTLALVHTRSVVFSGILRQGPAGEVAIGNGYFMLPPLPTAETTEQTSVEIELSVPGQ